MSAVAGDAERRRVQPGVVVGSQRGQASVLLVGLVAVVIAFSIALVGVLRLRADRLEAQRIADAASLGAVAALLRGGSPDEVRRQVERYVALSRRGATVPSFTVEPLTGAVILRVRLLGTRVGLPAILGPRPGPLAATAAARAQPGEAEAAIVSASVATVDGGAPTETGSATEPRGARRRALLVSSLPDGTDLRTLPRGVPPTYRLSLEAAADEQGLPVALLAAQLAQESGFDPRSLSPAGAEGIAQFMPSTWAGTWNPWRQHSPYEPAVAIRAQSLYLRGLLLAFRHDVVRALAAYNAGSSRAAGPASAWPLETRGYVEQIIRMLRAHDVSPQVAAGPLILDPVPRLTG